LWDLVRSVKMAMIVFMFGQMKAGFGAGFVASQATF
jgi:hypothetical protein